MPTLTPLALAALALLDESDMHPYEMYQLMLARHDDRLVKVRPGSLYHTIDRLARDELAQPTGSDRAGNRPERTTYRITEAGRAALRERLTSMLAEPAEEYPEFPLALSEAPHVPRDEFLRLLEQRRARLADRLAGYDRAAAGLAERYIPERYWIDLDYQRAMLGAELTWTRGLLDRVRDGRLPWEPPASDGSR
ncbi:MAG: transcriptional regulator [Naasia sp.]|nr:transcriptional regulator [Naasia sp.]